MRRSLAGSFWKPLSQYEVGGTGDKCLHEAAGEVGAQRLRAHSTIFGREVTAFGERDADGVHGALHRGGNGKGKERREDEGNGELHSG